jgi:hypothetical protein
MSDVSVRKSSLISSYAPGSILDFRTKNSPISCVVNIADQWEDSREIHEPRLERLLNVSGFREPPLESDEHPGTKGAVTYSQFPQWLQCPRCKFIAPLSLWERVSPSSVDRYCKGCSSGRNTIYCVPVRFVVACKAGHLDDLPWHEYVQHDKGCSRAANEIVLRLDSRGSGLGSIFLICKACGAQRSMQEAFKPNSFAELGRGCWSKAPWVPNSRVENERCQYPLKALQRGSSSIFYSNTKSALSIPPWSDELLEALAPDLPRLVSLSHEKLRDRVEFYAETQSHSVYRLMKKNGITADQLVNMITLRAEDLDGLTEAQLLYEEYSALKTRSSKPINDPPKGNFIAAYRDVPSFLGEIVTGVCKVKKLREVQALCSFSRIKPTTDPSLVQRVVSEHIRWLPAVENFGEGIFIDLQSNHLEEWEQNPEVIERVTRATKPFLEALTEAGRDTTEITPICTPRFLALHTLSHCLIRGVSNLCGYSSASLKERIYSLNPSEDSAVKPPAGILIYTASSDSDGTLGGLASLAEPEQLEVLVVESLKSSRWCSSDPLCINRDQDTFLLGSLASCHNCTLVPETTCSYFNRFLDRALLFGDYSGKIPGFLSGLLRYFT